MSRLRWVRLLAIAMAAVILASCRSLTAPVTTAATAVTVLPDDVRSMRHEDGSLAAAFAAVETGGEGREQAAPGRVRPAAVSIRRHEGVVPAGLEVPCPPLPRISMAAGQLGPDAPASAAACRSGRCPGDGTRAACPPSPCTASAGAIPVVRPCLVCDGGDHGATAKAVIGGGLVNLTAGDTVARFRPADDGPDADRVQVVESNCACIYAPRFAAVREVVRPLEDAAPLGPGGLVTDQLVDLRVERQPVWGSVQNLAPEAARRALPGVAVQEMLGPLAVDRSELPGQEQAAAEPAERLAIDQVELARGRQWPVAAVGFDVPVAWTCIKAANVLLDGQEASVVAADRGTATLRFEEPGRAELTLCKRAGTDTARVGEELDFTIFMLNSGDRPLTGIVLADALPGRLAFVPGSAASSLPADFSLESGDDGSAVLTWRLSEPLPAGASGFVRFRTLVR